MSDRTAKPDPAAILGIAISLRDAGEAAAKLGDIDISDTFNGYDQFYRELMRIAEMFEGWACKHVAFDEVEDWWPYQLEQHFGVACLKRVEVADLASFDEEDCPVIAMTLKLPLFYSDEPGLQAVAFRQHPPSRLPLDLTAANPVKGSEWKHWRIQTTRSLLNDRDNVEVMAYGDDPFDTEYTTPSISLYGVGKDGLAEHVRDFYEYASAVKFVRSVAPGVDFPDQPITKPKA